jgi:hypothetical protein
LHFQLLSDHEANCLKYYKPWELLPREEERIKSQITAAETQVRQEEEDFANRYPQYPRKKSSVIDKTNVTSIETVGEPHIESPSVSKADTTNNTPAQATQEQETSEKQSLEEQNGEVVVENEEDTVIY